MISDDTRLRAAIYARKSTSQEAVSDEQKSVTRQVDHARAYAASKGWAVAEDHIYIDDGISGAEFANRPGFLGLMNSLKPRPPFQCLIMSEDSRLGRESIETAMALKRLVQAGVRVFLYMEDRERTLDTPMDKVMMAIAGFGDELERDKGRQRTTDAMLRKARAGHVTGGRVFGYANVDVLDAVGARDHVVHVIKEEEAAVIRRIYQMCASGLGYTAITKRLNGEGAPAPRPQLGRPAGWSNSTVREVLFRERYRGTILYNQTKKRDRWGQQKPSARPEADVIRVDAPHLRIVDDAAWEAAHARLRRTRTTMDTAHGRRTVTFRDDDRSPHVLGGFTRCGTCGSALSVISRRHGRPGRSKRVFFYGCLAYHKRGPAVCANGLVLPVERVEAAVMQKLGADVLRPTVIAAIIEGVFAALAPTNVATNVDRLRAVFEQLTRRSRGSRPRLERGRPRPHSCRC